MTQVLRSGQRDGSSVLVHPSATTLLRAERLTLRRDPPVQSVVASRVPAERRNHRALEAIHELLFGDDEQKVSEHLTPRQFQVIRTIAASALTYKECGKVLGLHEQTVKNHVSAALAAYGADSFLELCLYLGWLRVPA